MVEAVPWDRPFAEPVELPKGKKLVTLRDAALYITKLPKAEHDAGEWQAAMAALLLVAEHDGPTMFARIGVTRALNRHVERVFDTSPLGTPEAGAGSMTGARNYRGFDPDGIAKTEADHFGHCPSPMPRLRSAKVRHCLCVLSRRAAGPDVRTDRGTAWIAARPNR
jgi:hypothetical protein